MLSNVTEITATCLPIGWFTVDPVVADDAILPTEYTYPHLIIPSRESRDDNPSYLHVYLPGTNSNPVGNNTAYSYLHSGSQIRSQNTSTVALSYCYGKLSDAERNQIVIDRHSDTTTQQQCLDSYHRDICLGGDSSAIVDVSHPNSIKQRLISLLIHLQSTRPVHEHWSQFLVLSPVSIDLNYSAIIVSGHSQGSGHAAFLALNFPFLRCVLVSGPQEYIQSSALPHHSWMSKYRNAGVFVTKDIVSFMHANEEDTADLMRTNLGIVHGPAYSLCDITDDMQSPAVAFYTTLPPSPHSMSRRPNHNSTVVDSATPVTSASGSSSSSSSNESFIIGDISIAQRPLYFSTVWPRLLTI